MEAVIKLLMEIVEEIHIGLKAAGVLAALEIFFGLKLGGSSPVSAYYQWPIKPLMNFMRVL